jgi:peptidoglycan hydrolase-like protein with peptidoglycan-binding domain
MTSLIKREAAIVAATLIVLFSIAFIGVRSASALVTTTLDVGATGAEVTDLQTYLATDPAIYPEGLVTGFYGPLTMAAVERFQCKYNIVCSGDSASTGYGRVGPITLGKIQSLEGGTTTTTTTTSSDTGGFAPIIGTEAVTVASTSATITWTVNQPAENSVLYASVWPFYIATAPSFSSATFGTTAIVNLTGLVPNHTYYYVRQSVNGQGDVQYGFGGTFTTSSN